MISGIQSLWVALSNDATAVCCEDVKVPNGNPPDIMPIELFRSITRLATKNHLDCRVLTNSRALPAAYEDVCRQIGAELIVPNAYEGRPIDTLMAVVIDQEAGTALNARLSPARIILRIRPALLGNLASDVQAMLGRVSRVSLRHPELLRYTDADLRLYQNQIEELGRWLAAHGPQWSSLRVDCLTDGINVSDIGECDAGNSHLAVGPDGQAYICPAYLNSGQGLGGLLGDFYIPDRHLFTRTYSTICRECSVDYCLRCVYHNKTSTREFGVSAANVCKLAHVEQRARAALAQELRRLGWWDTNWNNPNTPTILDPFETIDAEEVLPLWQQPALAAGRSDELNPGSMLEIVNELQGIVRAVLHSAQAGAEISPEYLLADTPLTRARARTIEAYRDVRFGPDCPTIREIERAVLGMMADSDGESSRCQSTEQ